MATITLQEFGGTKTVTLTPTEAQMFEAELRRVRGRWLSRAWGAKVRRYPVAPDCTIRVDDNGTITTYELSGRYHLRRQNETGSSTFYMGLLLLEWLYR
jgi:hypothetical protein